MADQIKKLCEKGEEMCVIDRKEDVYKEMGYKIFGKMDIYKNKGRSYSNSGISSKYDEVVVVDEFNEEAPENAVVIIKDRIINTSIERLRAVPANFKGKWDMFGGCFIYTSNGIVPHHGIVIELHDRLNKP